MGGPSSDPLRLAARLALVRSLAPCGEASSLAQPDAVQVARLNAAVRQLTETQREIFLAVRLHDSSLREVAEELAMLPDEVEREFIAALLAVTRALEGP